MTFNCDPYVTRRDSDGHDLFVLAIEVTVTTGGRSVQYPSFAEAQAVAKERQLQGRGCAIDVTVVEWVDQTEAYRRAYCPLCATPTVVWTPPRWQRGQPWRVDALRRAGMPVCFADDNALCRDHDDEAYARHYGRPLDEVRRLRDAAFGRDGWGLSPRPQLPRRETGGQS